MFIGTILSPVTRCIDLCCPLEALVPALGRAAVLDIDGAAVLLAEFVSLCHECVTAAGLRRLLVAIDTALWACILNQRCVSSDPKKGT